MNRKKVAFLAMVLLSLTNAHDCQNKPIQAAAPKSVQFAISRKKQSRPAPITLAILAIVVLLLASPILFAPIARLQNQVWKSIDSTDLDFDANTGMAYDFNYTKYTLDGNIMPTGELRIPDTELPGGGLVGYWKLDTNVGRVAVDSSGQGNIGTWKNGADSNGSWFFDQNAGFFDGVDDYVDAGNDASLQLNKTFTLAAWVYLNVDDDTPTRIISKGKVIWTAPYNGFELVWLGEWDEWDFYVADSDTEVERSQWEDPDAVGKWKYIVGTFDNGFDQGFID